MAITTYQANKVNDYLFGKTAYTPPTNYYIGLSTTAINAAGTGATEPSGGAYARVSVANSKTTFSNSASGKLSNKVQIEFPESTASWGTITYVFIADAASGGHILYYDQLTNSRTVQTASVLLFAVGALQIQIS